MIIPFLSSFDIGFWYQLADKKLNDWKLDNSPKIIRGHFSNALKPGLPCIFDICEQAFKDKLQLPSFCHVSNGKLLLANTKEDFSKFDKKSLLQFEIAKIIDSIHTGHCFDEPTSLMPFTVLCFADLKKYTFVYWCCFPSIHLSVDLVADINICALSDNETAVLDDATLCNDFLWAIDLNSRSNVNCKELLTRETLDGVWFVCADPSTDTKSVGWSCRNVINALLFHFGSKTKSIKLICLRIVSENNETSYRNSLVLDIPTRHALELTEEAVSCSGWEKNKDKLLPKMADLSKVMDPKVLSKNAVELNLKLMKWRIVPDLDLDKIAQQKCLLFGAGTLGCNVARLLLAWGVTKITLVDNGRVSYSNPVRQSLFKFEDAMGGSCTKVEAAAKHLKQINPSCEVDALDLSIPMPGHPVAALEKEKVTQTLQQLSELVRSHDCIFLLLDTREARWLPTVLGKFYRKIVINAALGFDSYLVMRHGVQIPGAGSATGDVIGTSSMLVSNSSVKELGCYFCSDVMAPGDSLSDRTLDQQCTVTRPGTSMIASSLAVELFVSCVVHPDGAACGASICESESPDSALGPVPHQIRGWLSQLYKQITPYVEAYSKCVACSASVLDAYKERGVQFLFEVFNEPSFLEDITGLARLKIEMEEDFANEIIALSDDDNDDD